MIRKVSTIFALIVFSALALNAQTSPDKGGVVVSKTAKNNYDGTYTINIEAFVIGKQVTTTGVVSQPVDAVLVLDVSGSMSEPVSKSGIYRPSYTSGGKKPTTKYYTVAEWRTVASTLAPDQNIYVRPDGDEDYYLLMHGGAGSGFTTDKSNFYLNYISVQDTWPIYIGGKTRLQALQESVEQFVSTMKLMQDQYNYETRETSEPMIQHRVGIVTFANNTYLTQNKLVLTLANGALDTDKAASTLISSINNTVDGLKAIGATEADKGMGIGYNELYNNGRDDASKLVVFFTDGYPTSSSDFEAGVANGAIDYGHKIKSQLDASIYVVSVINPYEPNPRNFMNYLSSNYPGAKSLYSPGTGGEMGGKYFMVAPDEAALKQAFVGIAKDFTSGGAAFELTSETITADIVMSDFQIQKSVGNVNMIDVYVKPLTKLTGNETDGFDYTWGSKTADKALTTVIEDDATTGNHIVKVKGFAFSDHWCGYDYKDGVVSGLHENGQKLCLDIKLIPNLDKAGGLVATNDPISGLYLEKPGEDGLGTQLASFGASPVVYAPCDIIVERQGLKPEESAMYRITREKADGTVDPDYEMIVVVTADDGGLARTIVKGDATYGQDSEGNELLYTYVVEAMPKAEEGRWDWSYSFDDDAAIDIHRLYENGQLTNEFIFTADRNALDENTYDEAAAKNVFKKLNTESN